MVNVARAYLAATAAGDGAAACGLLAEDLKREISAATRPCERFHADFPLMLSVAERDTMRDARADGVVIDGRDATVAVPRTLASPNGRLALRKIGKTWRIRRLDEYRAR